MRESAEQMPRLTHTARLYQRLNLALAELHPFLVHAAAVAARVCVEKGEDCGRHSPAMGGKRMARKPKKISLPHMLFNWYCSEVLIRCLRKGGRGVKG